MPMKGRVACRSLLSTFNRQSPETAAKILISDMTCTKELIYTGPVNSLIRRLQLSLTSTALGSAVGAPLLLHYFTNGWSFSSQTFFTLSGRQLPSVEYIKLCLVAGTAMLQSWMGHRLLGRYVAHVHRLVPSAQSLTEAEAPPQLAERIELVSYDWFGRQQKRVLSPSALEAEGKGAWTPMGQTRPYLLFHGNGKQTDYFRKLASSIEHGAVE